MAALHWQKLTLRVPADRVAGIESLLDAAGANAVSLADAADEPVLEPEPGATPLWPDVNISALFPAELELASLSLLLAAALGDEAEVTVEALDDAAWSAAGREPVEPRRIGPRLWLAPADARVTADAGRCVRLHMGHAFGTGRHPTTSLCLEWLERRFEAGATLLDYGCGSGVLALAGLALGARAAWATDNDPEALAAARRNAALNGADTRLWIGLPGALPAIQVDTLVANILARPLIDRAAYFAARVATGGSIVLSGVLSSQRSALLGAYAPQFEDLTVIERDGWLLVAGRRRDSGANFET